MIHNIYYNSIEAEFLLRLDRRKSPVGTFPPKHPHCPHSLSAKPTIRTVVRIEVFFAPGDPWQKTDLKCPLRGQNILFDILKRSFCSAFLFENYHFYDFFISTINRLLLIKKFSIKLQPTFNFTLIFSNIKINPFKPRYFNIINRVFNKKQRFKHFNC